MNSIEYKDRYIDGYGCYWVWYIVGYWYKYIIITQIDCYIILQYGNFYLFTKISLFVKFIRDALSQHIVNT